MVTFDSTTGTLLRKAAGVERQSSGELGKVDWDQFTSLAIEHRIAPLALKNLSNLLPEDAAARLKSSALKSSQVNLRLTTELFRVVKLLNDARIQAVPFKGPVTAQLYGDLSLRPF